MALNRTAWLDSITDTSTTIGHELGTLREFIHGTYGPQVYRYILNADVISLTAGGIVQHKTSTIDGGSVISCVTAKRARNACPGVAQSTIPTLNYGWVLALGRGLVRGDGNVTKDTAVMSEGTTGRAKIATLTNADEVAAVIGWSVEDDGAADSTFNCLVSLL